MRTIIKNGIVITMNPNRKKYEKLDVIIDNDTIVDIVDNYTGKYDKLIDATNKVVMPGLINAHTHLGMSYFKATNDNLSLQKWLTEKIWPIENKMTEEDSYYATLASLIEMIKTGTTTSNDMYFNCEGAIKAIKEAKVRSLFTRCLLNTDNKGKERINEFISLYEKYKDEELIKFSVSPHALYTCDLDYLKECSKLANKYNLPVHIHYSENKKELDDVKNSYNMTSLEVLKKSGLINNKLILAHCTFISDEELNTFKDKDISFVHNPVSNLNLGCGISNIVKYKEYVNIALGTDGVGSGNNLNMFYHMSLVDLLQKGIHEDSKVLNSYEVLKMATINGAKALGMDKEIGSIEVGKNADIIILDMNNILSKPTSNLINSICHNAFNNVTMTMVNGEVLMLDKKLLLDVNEEELIRIIEKRMEELNKG